MYETNIRGRQIAEDALALASQLIREEAGGDAQVAARAFRVLGDSIDAITCTTRVSQPDQSRPMSDSEARSFEDMRLPARYKAHAGKRVKDVPISYLVYLDESQDEWPKKIKAYLQMRKIWEEQSE